MLQFNKYSAWITVDDKPLEEYEVKVDEATSTVTCWIGSELGKAYKVYWREDQYRWPSAGYFVIDGQECGGQLMRSSSRTRCKEGIHSTSTTRIPFTFCDVKTSDDSSLLSDPEAPDVGSIEIQISQVRVKTSGLPWRPRGVPVSKEFHETTKKMVDHQTSFEKPAVAVKRHKDVEVDFIGSPVAVFHFRYRPLAILQAKEIAPRPSLPLPVSGTKWKQELNSNGGPIAELLKVKDEDTKRIKDLQVKVEDIKPARVELDALRKKRSQKNGEGPRKKPKREPIVGLTIDLTKD